MTKRTKTKEENPLGVLLDLLEKEKLDISDFSLAQIADDYLEYLSNFQNQEKILENISEFLWVASRLALIKSKILVASFDFTEEDFKDEEIGEDLKERLVEYKKFQEISKKIALQFRKNKKLFSRKNQIKVDKEILINFSKEDLVKIFKKIIFDFKTENQIIYQKKSIKETIKIEEKIKQIKVLLKKNKHFQFSKLIPQKASRLEIVISFLSVLELVKQGSIKISQGGCFQEINIAKK